MPPSATASICSPRLPGLLVKSMPPRDPTGEMVRLLEQLGSSRSPPSWHGAWASGDGSRALMLLQTRAAQFEHPTPRRRPWPMSGVRSTARPRRPFRELVMTGPGVFSVTSRNAIKDQVSRLSRIRCCADRHLAVAGLSILHCAGPGFAARGERRVGRHIAVPREVLLDCRRLLALAIAAGLGLSCSAAGGGAAPAGVLAVAIGLTAAAAAAAVAGGRGPDRRRRGRHLRGRRRRGRRAAAGRAVVAACWTFTLVALVLLSSPGRARAVAALAILRPFPSPPTGGSPPPSTRRASSRRRSLRAPSPARPESGRLPYDRRSGVPPCLSPSSSRATARAPARR